MIKQIMCSVLLMVIAAPVQADIETDRLVGNCAGLLSALKRPRAAIENAASFADNKNRAIKFAMAWLNKANKYSSDKIMMQSIVYSATSDCRKIGINTSD